MFFRIFSFNYTFSKLHTQKTHLKNIIKIALSKNTFLKMLPQNNTFSNIFKFAISKQYKKLLS